MGRFFDEIAKVVGGGVSRRGALRKIGGAFLAAVGLGGFARRASADTLAACNAYCAGRGFTAGSAFIQCRNACLPCPTTAQLCGATAATLTCCPTPANSTVNCVNNACAVTACANGFRNCDNSVANGCETNVLTSNSNCGTCGNACAQGQTCTNGTCVGGGGNCHQFNLSGFTCPTGATQYCDANPISPTNSAQAKAACETCYGTTCFLETADCAGPGYGPNLAGQYQCGNAYFGYTPGCSGVAGRIWSICNSFTTYGTWG